MSTTSLTTQSSPATSSALVTTAPTADVFSELTELGRFLGYFYKEMLERYQKQVKSIQNWEVMVIRPEDQASHNSELWEKRLRFANRRARAGLTHTRVERLDVEQKRERSEAIARVGALETFMER